MSGGQIAEALGGAGILQPCKNMQKAARLVLDQYDGCMPGDYESLLKLPGIGPYTAGAVASIAFGIPVPAVDGNVLRVITRLTASEADIAARLCAGRWRDRSERLCQRTGPGTLIRL